MEPYYSDASCTIYHADCRDVLPLEADVLITDPPYGVGLSQKHHKDGAAELASATYSDVPEQVAALIREVIPLALSACDRGLVFSGARMLWQYPEPADVGSVFTQNSAGLSRWGFACTHPVLFYGKDPFLADGRGSRPNSFRTDQLSRERFDHPCPKQISWIRWAVERASRPGELILDPCMGSGTTLRAAKDCGRRAVGIEIEERYCEIAAKRLAQEVLPLGA